MLRIYADRYIRLGERIRDAKSAYDFLDNRQPGDPGLGLFKAEMDMICDDLRDILRLCDELTLHTASKLIQKRLNDIPQTRREYEILIEAVYAELEGKLFLYVPTHLAKFYDDEDILSTQAKDAFPSSYRELKDGGLCLACGASTAAVFHSMRAAEIGVRILGKALNVSFPNKPIDMAEWQQVLDQSDTKIRSIGQQPKSAQRDEDQQFYASAATQFRYFKDGWRVRVAHARATYTESEAMKILDHTRDFFEGLAPRMRE